MNKNLPHIPLLKFFTLGEHTYYAGTQFLYSGQCIINGQEVILTQQLCTFLYSQDADYFQVGTQIASYKGLYFTKHIVAIIDPVPKPQLPTSESDFFWTEEMSNNTFCYIVAMLFGFVVQNCISWWILATIIYYNTTFRKEK